MESEMPDWPDDSERERWDEEQELLKIDPGYLLWLESLNRREDHAEG